MRLTITKQLGLTFSAIILLMLLSTLVMRGYLGAVETATEQIGSKSIPLALTVADMRFHAVNVQQFFTDVSATGEAQGLKEAEESAEQFRKSLDSAKQIQSKRGDKNAQAELAELDKSFAAMYDLGKRMAQAYVSKGREAGNPLMQGFDKTTNDLSKRLEKISTAHASEATAQVQSLDGKLRTGLNIQWGLLLISALLCAGLGFAFTRLLRRQLGAEPADLEAAAHRIASGDYAKDSTCVVPGTGGVSGALCVMVGKLEEAMTTTRQQEKDAQERAIEAAAMLRQGEAKQAEVQALLSSMQAASQKAQQAGERIFSAIKDLADNMGNVSRDVVVQKDRMASTRTAMDQMNEAILEIARNTGNAAQSAEQSKANATSGAKGVREAVAATEQVKDRIISLKETMAQLGTQADSIGQVIGVINDIADQTNLLALNAAIEAARAGDAGRGFAVVADEVRKLAEKTVTATKQVGESVQSIQARARENVEAVDTAAKDIMVSSQLAEESGQSMEAIVGIVQSTALEVASIATASEEQSATSEEIKRAVEEVNHATENTARSVDQSQRIVVEISGLAEELDMIIQGMASGKLDSAISSDKLIEWSPSISVGINTIDDQHKVLIDLINELHAAMRQRKSDSVMLDVVARLKNYTVKHFGFEEELFAKHHYPETEGHIDLHRKFVQKIADFEAGIKSGTATVGMEVMRFLKDWLIKHIQGTDTRYAPFMIEKGVR